MKFLSIDITIYVSCLFIGSLFAQEQWEKQTRKQTRKKGAEAFGLEKVKICP